MWVSAVESMRQSPPEREKLAEAKHRKSAGSLLELSSIAFLAKTLSDENRLRILLSVSHGKKSVSRIVEELDLSQPLVSHHLKELRLALLVKVERKGPFIYYELADARVTHILVQLHDLADDLLENRKSF